MTLSFGQKVVMEPTLLNRVQGYLRRQSEGSSFGFKSWGWEKSVGRDSEAKGTRKGETMFLESLFRITPHEDKFVEKEDSNMSNL